MCVCVCVCVLWELDRERKAQEDYEGRVIVIWGDPVQFSSVPQSCPTLCNPWNAACQASVSITNFQSLPKLMSIESEMPSNHLILCRPLLHLTSIFPSIRVFTNESALHIRWPKYWSFSFNISPSSEDSGLISFRMDWLDLLAVQGTLKSLLQHHSSKASILLHSALFIVQLRRHYFVNKNPSSQGYGFSSSHVWMWELDYKESWAPKNWCFWTVVLKKTLESPLDCKEIQQVHPKGDQSWLFTGRTDVEAKTPIIGHLMWRADSFQKTLMLGKIEGRRRRGQQRMRWLDGITDSKDEFG